GVERVVAMQYEVTDSYAAALGRGLYRRLARNEDPTVGAALAQARQELERRQAAGSDAGELLVAEYATPTLVTAGEDTAIVDHRADARPLQDPPVHQVHPIFPQLGVGEFIDRKPQSRRTLRVLRDDEREVARDGRRRGVVLTSM